MGFCLRHAEVDKRNALFIINVESLDARIQLVVELAGGKIHLPLIEKIQAVLKSVFLQNSARLVVVDCFHFYGS